MTNTYTTLAGTPADAEEQHEPRTIQHDRSDGSVHMMTEIQDGTFVAWTNCATCKYWVNECTCKNGPQEPSYVERWRLERFVKSFTGRKLLPALPEAIKQKDRRVNAVIRLLRSQGWTITAPEQVVDPPTDDDGLDDGLDADNLTGNLGFQETVEDEPGSDSRPNVDGALDAALTAARRRAQEDTSDEF